MIQINELRIGNWINEQDFKLQVGMIQQGLFDASEPIPLTEEWLIRFGIAYDGQVSDNTYWYNRRNKCLCEDYSEGDGGTHIIAECLYVHQLQNLYFYLTGQELTIKENAG